MYVMNLKLRKTLSLVIGKKTFFLQFHSVKSTLLKLKKKKRVISSSHKIQTNIYQRSERSLLAFPSQAFCLNCSFPDSSSTEQ